MQPRYLSIICAFCTLFFLASCREDTIINASVTPSVDNIHTFGIGPEFGNDTISLTTTTVYDDSIVTSSSISGYPIYHALGWLNQDPYSGNTAGSVYLQVIPPVSSGFALSSAPDSGFLVLPYANFVWGDTTAPSTQTYKVYAISQPFSKDSTFYAFSKLSTGSEVIGSGSFHIAPKPGTVVDSPYVGVGSNGRVAPHLRIELTKSFLSRLHSYLSSGQDSSYAAYMSAMPGFYIVPDSAGVIGRAMPYFRIDPIGSNLYGEVAGMVLYKDTNAYSFPFNPNYTAHYNRVTRKYGQQAQNLFNPSTADGLVMIQNQPGAALDVVIPNISGLPKNVVINKCELVITQVPPGDDRYSYPSRIYPQGIDASGARYPILDRLPLSTGDGLDFIDGTPHTAVVNGNTVIRYSVNFPRELQRAIVQGQSQLHLHIGGTQSFPGAYRLVAGGRQHPLYKMALNVVYSKQ